MMGGYPVRVHWLDRRIEHDGGPKTFTGPQISLVAVPDLGTLASVTLHVTPIAEITFTVLLPARGPRSGKRRPKPNNAL